MSTRSFTYTQVMHTYVSTHIGQYINIRPYPYTCPHVHLPTLQVETYKHCTHRHVLYIILVHIGMYIHELAHTHMHQHDTNNLSLKHVRPGTTIKLFRIAKRVMILEKIFMKLFPLAYILLSTIFTDA